MAEFHAHSSVPEWYATPELVEKEAERVKLHALHDVAKTMEDGQPYVLTISMDKEQHNPLGDYEILCDIQVTKVNNQHIELPPLDALPVWQRPKPFTKRIGECWRYLFRK